MSAWNGVDLDWTVPLCGTRFTERDWRLAILAVRSAARLAGDGDGGDRAVELRGTDGEVEAAAGDREIPAVDAVEGGGDGVEQLDGEGTEGELVGAVDGALGDRGGELLDV